MSLITDYRVYLLQNKKLFTVILFLIRFGVGIYHNTLANYTLQYLRTLSQKASILIALPKSEQNMDIIQANLGITQTTDQLLFKTFAGYNYLWDNLIIEKRSSVNWLTEMYKNSIFHDVWLLFSSPVV